MAPEPDSEARVPPVIERFVRQLIVADKAVSLYPPSSAIPRDTARRRRRHPRRGAPRDTRGALRGHARRALLRRRSPSSRGTTPSSRSRASSTTACSPTSASTPAPSPATSSRSSPCSTTRPTSSPPPAASRRGCGSTTSAPSRSPRPRSPSSTPRRPPSSRRVGSLSADEIDELVAIARRGGARRAARTIARFMSNPPPCATYLDGVARRRWRDAASIAWPTRSSGSRTSRRASSAEERDETHARRSPRPSSSSPRRSASELVGERLLPEARSSAPLAAVVRQMDIDQVCRMFAHTAPACRTAHARWCARSAT